MWKMFYDNGIMFNYEGKTSGIKNFMTETFLANKWVKAPTELIHKFFDVVKDIYSKIDINIAENNGLIKQRDELLPLLMNGQVSLNSDLSNRCEVTSIIVSLLAALPNSSFSDCSLDSSLRYDNSPGLIIRAITNVFALKYNLYYRYSLNTLYTKEKD